MHRKIIKLYVVIFLLIGTIIYCFAYPKPKYVSTDIFSQLAIPCNIKDWQGRDAEQGWNLEENKYNFISQIFNREYVNKNKENIYLLILNAGNFHNPKVCSRGAGFEIKELDNLRFNVLNRTFEACSLYVGMADDGYLIIYWVCMDKNIVSWTGQKIKELYYTLINKNKIRLMIRLDVPCKEKDIGDATMAARKFVEDLIQSIPTVQAEYIFGRENT